MKAITYELRLTEPLLATQVNSGEPNSAISFPFVPGSMVRGALIRRYLNEKPRDFDLADDDDARRLFLDGTVQFLNAYPSHDGQRLLPKPFSWFVAKDELENKKATLHNFAVVDPEKLNLDKPKSPHGDFVGATSKGVWLQSPTRQVNVHNFTDKPGRKQAGNSQVYRYEALAAGQTMAGAIIATGDVDLSILRDYLNEMVMVLGGSHTGGYGRIEVVSVELDLGWEGEYTEDSNSSDIQTITFLSDAIIRTPLELNVLKKFQKMRVVGGFNRKWGLPLPQSWAIQAGSVWAFDGEVKTAVLQEWVENGVGERRAEGYGRVALNWHTSKTQQQFDIAKTVKEEGDQQTEADAIDKKKEPKLSTRSETIAQKMANRRLRTKLENELERVLHSKKNKLKGLPSSTQLSRVRLAARRALAEQRLSPIQEHMDGLTGAKKDWDKAKIGKNPLWDWILKQSKEDAAVFKKQFNLPNVTIAGVSAALTTETEIEFRARLIDGVMKLAVKEKQKREGGRS